jgi:hypothetical protein
VTFQAVVRASRFARRHFAASLLVAAGAIIISRRRVDNSALRDDLVRLQP